MTMLVRSMVLATVLLLSTGPVPLMAQQSPPAQSQDSGGSNWGWVGLLGLAGLAGLMGRRDRRP